MGQPDPYYAVEKLGLAVDALVAGSGSIHDRVIRSCLHLARVEASDFPSEALSREFDKIMARVGLDHRASNNDLAVEEAIAEMTVSSLPTSAVADLARRIVRLEREMESHFRQRPFHKDSSSAG